MDALAAIVDEAMRLHPELAALKAALKRMNETHFDREFVGLARAVYHNNDERGRLKSQINALLKSDITEEKQYSHISAALT